MAYDIQQSTTQSVLLFFMVQSADHITALTGATPTVTISKNGAAFGSPTGAVTEIANGWYKVAGNATDTNTLGSLVLHAEAATADNADKEFEVMAVNPQAANPPVDLVKILGTAPTEGAAGRLAAALTKFG